MDARERESQFSLRMWALAVQPQAPVDSLTPTESVQMGCVNYTRTKKNPIKIGGSEEVECDLGER